MHNMVTALLLVMCFLAANATEIGCRMWLVEMEIGQLTKFPIETNHRGFSGSGFVNHENDSSEAVFFVNTDLGSGPLGIRYAAGTDDRFMMVSVNGFSQQVRFPSTGSWTNWETVKTQDFLWKQGNNEFKIYAVPGKNGPNLDSFSVCITELPPRQLGETCGSCFCPPTFTAGECAEGLVCEHSSIFEDLPGNCVEDRTAFVSCVLPGCSGKNCKIVGGDSRGCGGTCDCDPFDPPEIRIGSEGECPEIQPEVGSPCTEELSCSYGEECCCGECHSSVQLECTVPVGGGVGEWGGFFTEACSGASRFGCPDDQKPVTVCVQINCFGDCKLVGADSEGCGGTCECANDPPLVRGRLLTMADA